MAPIGNTLAGANMYGGGLPKAFPMAGCSNSHAKRILAT